MADVQKQEHAEPAYARPNQPGSRPPFFVPSIDKYLTPENVKFFAEYSKIPPEELSAHVHDIREKAWSIRTYPCTGLGVWLEPFIARSPAYAEIVARLQRGQRLLDVGVFLGADLRALAAAGAPTANMVGVDIADHWTLGFELYRDAPAFAASFVHADILAADSVPALAALRGSVDVLSISAVLHQWSWAGQVRAACTLVLLTRPDALVVGYQIGDEQAGEIDAMGSGTMQYRHNAASFAKLWDEVGALTGTEWQTTAALRQWEFVGWDRADMGWIHSALPLEFVIRRLK